MLRLTRQVFLEMVGHCLDGLPLEACGLLAAAPGTDGAVRCYPMRNAAESSRIYVLDGREILKVDKDAEQHGLEIVGVFHSHTHTEAYPSPTDVAQAPDPSWHYVLVSLRAESPVVRSYRIVDGNITEEQVVVGSR